MREKFGPSFCCTIGRYCIRIARALTLTLLLNSSNVITLVLNNVSGNVITVTGTPTPGSFFMFLKDPVVNLSSVVGEYAEVTLRNNSKEQAELFSLGSEISVSSK